MKKLFIYSILSIALTTNSCKNGFLEENPYSFFSEEGVYSTDAGAMAALTGLYSSVADYDYFGAAYFSLVTQASASFWANHAQSRDLTALTITPNVYWNYSVFDQSYTTINRANNIIANLPNDKVSTTVGNNILGQAYFIRAMVYFNLVRLYGGVPLRTTPVGPDNLNLPRSTSKEIYDLIIADLERAKTLLPAPAAQTKGYPHRFAPYALLGKVYVTLAGNDESSPYWQNAKTELLEVVNNEGTSYSLLPRFANLWDYTQENSVESIFEVQFIPAGAQNGQLTNLFMPKRINTQPNAVAPAPFARLRVNKEVYDRHIAQYPGDPRIAGTFINTYMQISGTNQPVYPANTAGEGFPYLKKYEDASFVSNSCNRNLVYMRYADVLLLLAEAENEINGPDNAYQYVNKVLARARTSVTPASTVPANYSGMTKVSFRDRIMKERFYELLGEFHEYYDIRRRGEQYFLDYLRAHNSYSRLNASFDFIYPVDKKLLLLPIPEKEMNTNTALKPSDQNPGY